MIIWSVLWDFLCLVVEALCPSHTCLHFRSLYLVPGCTWIRTRVTLHTTMDAAHSIQSDIQSLKESVELAHENNSRTQSQVSNFLTDFQSAKDRLTRLENELGSLKSYVGELENYCISLDTIVRKHHLILVGVVEKKDESVNLAAYKILQICCPEIQISDIDYCYRIGTQAKSSRTDRNSPRPILCKLVREDLRRLIYKNRIVLKQSKKHNKVFINEDLPQVISSRRNDIRSVFLNAKKKGHKAKMAGTRVIVDNVSYGHKDLEILPPGLKLSDSKMVRVKGGLAFASEHAFLSNFFTSTFSFNGVEYDSAERAYQCTRATRLNEPELAQQIYRCRDAKECKKLSHHAVSTPEWDAQKRAVMTDIVSDKFAQNLFLQEKLLLTGKKTLIEATTDSFWGAAAIMGSKPLNKGKWKGLNVLGTILGEIREDTKRTQAWRGFHVSSSDDQSDTEVDSTTSESLTDELSAPGQSTSDHSLTLPQGVSGNISSRKQSLNQSISSPVLDLSQVRLSSVTTRRGSSSQSKKNKRKKQKNKSISQGETDMRRGGEIDDGGNNNTPLPSQPATDLLTTGNSVSSTEVGIEPPPPPPAVTGRPSAPPSLNDDLMTPNQSHPSSSGGISTPHLSDRSIPRDPSASLQSNFADGPDSTSDSDQRLFWQHVSPPTTLYSNTKKGMYLSSISHWNNNPMLEIPRQFFQVPEPPYTLAMDGRMPIYSADYNVHAFSSPGLRNSLGIPFTGTYSTSHSGLGHNVSSKVNLSSSDLSVGITDQPDKLLPDFSLSSK